ncbi:Cullin-associated NEDD8-dissociated protein 2, partial [Coemansia sp. RSA 1365]
MAISDILELLRTSRSKLSKAEGEQCTEAFIKLLSDTQSHVQNLAAECLDQVVHLIEADTIKKAILEICTNIQKSGREAGGCALSVGLRRMTARVVEELDDNGVLGSLATPIVTVLQNTSELPSDVMIDIFGALSEVLTHAGSQIGADNGAVSQTQELLFNFIGSSNVAVRRRAIAALGAFVVHVPGERSEEALDEIYQRYRSCTQDSDKCILLRVLVAIAQQRPARVTKLVPTIVDTEIGAIEESERELHVTLLFMFETFVRCCTELVADKCDEIYRIAADAVKFDPNYSYSDDEGMDTSSEGDLENEFGDDSDGDAFEDDEDDSWDVRLGGVKLLSAISKSGLLNPSDIVNRIGGVLLKSFREREDVVRAEIMLTYAAVVEELQKEESASNSGVVDALREQAPK